MKFSLVLLLAGVASASPVLKSYKARALDALDFEIVNLAQNLESLELNYWNQALANFTEDDFAAAGFAGFSTYLKLFRDQEIAHFTLLHDAAGGDFTNCTYTFPVTTPQELLTMGQVVTTVGQGAFIGALGNLTDSGARQSGGSILGNEGRQNSKLREFLGLDFFNGVNFDTPLTASQAFSLAEPFFKCPASNPPINFHLIPPLTAEITDASSTYSAGDSITVKWDSTTINLGPDVHIRFLSDLYAIDVPLDQTGNGVGVTSLPAGINGTAFLSATNFQGGGPIPDTQNFAIGFFVVA